MNFKFFKNIFFIFYQTFQVYKEYHFRRQKKKRGQYIGLHFYNAFYNFYSFYFLLNIMSIHIFINL